MTTLLAAFLVAAPQEGPDIRTVVQSTLRDASFVAEAVRADQRELRKINDDFGQSYRFKRVQIRAKDPFMLRLETRVDDTDILYVINGTTLVIRIPRARINSRQNLGMSPGRRQTWLDFGILTPSLFDDFMRAKFVRKDRATGNLVYDLTYEPRMDDTSRNRVWIDPDQRFVTRREWYGQSNQPKAVFLYEKPVEANGVWLPTQVSVRNNDGVIAGVTRYSAWKVNTGLAESLFDVK